MVSKKMVEFLHVRRSEKEIEQFLLSNTFSVYTILVLKCFVTERLDMVQKSLWISSHFYTENYIWRPDMVQKCFAWFLWTNVPKYISENI